MRGRWRLPLCVAVVLLAHAGLMAAWLRPSASAVPRPSPHQAATLRLVVLGPIAEPAAAPPEPLRVGDGSAEAATDAPSTTPPSPAADPQPQATPVQSALAPEPASAPPSPRVTTIAPVHDFLSPAQVDRGAIAFPSPDISGLSGLSWSGTPLRLRLFVDAGGRCVDVQFLRTDENPETLDRLRAMFLATHFLPARRAGEDVDSYRDLELNVSDVK